VRGLGKKNSWLCWSNLRVVSPLCCVVLSVVCVYDTSSGKLERLLVLSRVLCFDVARYLSSSRFRPGSIAVVKLPVFAVRSVLGVILMAVEKRKMRFHCGLGF
jgi:hypothetical protein